MTPPVGTATPWETHPGRSGRLVSIRCEHHRTRGVGWRVVSHDSPTPAEAFARGNLAVHVGGVDEASAREVLHRLARVPGVPEPEPLGRMLDHGRR